MMRSRCRPARCLGLILLALFAATPRAEADAKSTSQAAKAKSILKAYCYRCHGENGRAEGGFNVVTDLAKLVDSKRVVPGKPAESKLYKKVMSGNMPPKEDAEAGVKAAPPPRPKPEEIATLKEWVESGAPVGDPAPPRPVLTDLDVQRIIADDLKTVPQRARRFTRYFTLAHLQGAGDNDDQVETYRHGLSKLVNSLSWNRRIVVPKMIGPAGVVARIDMRDYGWTQEVWEAILAEYPFGLELASTLGKAISDQTQSPLPHIRADWFVFAASRPPLYHVVLRLPNGEAELEQQLHIDTISNIGQELAVRAGFGESGISRNNRLIERHESGYGAYWKSYDFAGNADRKNLFAHPLGPGDRDFDFAHDGGEIIFALPNGLHAYMLVNGDGQRIDKGPTEIVRDGKQSDGAVVNGISCMSCHARGMIEKSDQLRSLAERPGTFPRDVADAVLALYPPRDRFDNLLREDAERFAQAVKATGASLSQTEPVYALARQFEADLDLKRASAEVGLEPGPFRDLLARAPTLGQVLGPLLVGSPVKRDAFVEAFPLIAEARHLPLLATHSPFSPAVRPARPATIASAPPPTVNRSAPRSSWKGYPPERLSEQPPRWGNDRDHFRDVAPAGNLLVGIRATYIERWGGNKVRSVQPIFRNGRDLVLGDPHGQVVGPEFTFVAKAGYAVGAIRTRTGLTVDGFELVYMRVKGDRLDPNDNYNSPVIGDSKGGGPGGASGEGSPIVGIHGRSNQELNALGLILLK